MNIYQELLFAIAYDQSVRHTDDVRLIQKLIEHTYGAKQLAILEGLCGTGRVVIPLAHAGHTVSGVDANQAMLERAREKVRALPIEMQKRICLRPCSPTIDDNWGQDMDIVILTGNALYEFSERSHQEGCIRLASKALKLGGWLYLDNLQRRTQSFFIGEEHHKSIVGTDEAHVYGEAGSTVIDINHDTQMIYYERYWLTREANGRTKKNIFPSARRLPYPEEICRWLETYGLRVAKMFGDRIGNSHISLSQ